MESGYDFDEIIDRSGTGSLKWDRYRNRDVIPLWVADMDFRSPPAVIDALRVRAVHGVFGYTVPHDEVENEVTAYLARRHGLEIKPDWLVWLPGLVPALNLACRAYAEPGESVMTAIPVYPPFLSAPVFSGRRLQKVPLQLTERDWTIDVDAMEAAIDQTTRVLIFCNPHNPVGRAYRREEIEQVVALCRRHDLILVSDEIHCDLILDPEVRHVSTASMPDLDPARLVTLMAPSKTYNLPGLSCAFAIVSDAATRSRFKQTARGIITEVNAFGYAGCTAAYRHGESWRRDLIVYLRGNRDLVYAWLRDRMPELGVRPMEATYLAWVDCRMLPVADPAGFFEQHGVGLSNGEDFGWPGFVRLNFGCPRETLREALRRMESAIHHLLPSADACSG